MLQPLQQQQAQPAPGTMYVRVKRKKAAYFIHIDPSDTVANLKLELARLTQQVISHCAPLSCLCQAAQANVLHQQLTFTVLSVARLD